MSDIAKFIDGFKQFQKNYFCGSDTLFSSLAQGQSPSTMVIACSDSRVDPAILTGCAPGELFIVRNVANLVPPYQPDPGHHGVSAALEFAVKHLKVENIIVLGHGSCGGITSLLEHGGVPPEEIDQPSEFISQWVQIGEPARQRVREELAGQPAGVVQQACEQAAIQVSLENLLTFPWVKQRADAGNLQLYGWYFDLETGDLSSYMTETGKFEPLVPHCKQEQTA